MRYRKLRIAWWVAWGIVVVLLCVLWMRSYLALESWMASPLYIQSAKGKVIIFALPNEYRPGRFYPRVEPAYSGYSKIPYKLLAPHKVFSAVIAGSEIWIEYNYQGKRIFVVPFWTAVLAAAVLPVAPWITPRCRFSLRTLLIAITLVAVALGLIAFTARG